MISVCIATYNGEGVIGEQVGSILPQLGPEDEVVISDDHSTDGTLAVLAGFRDARIKVFEGPAMGSPIPNFENALMRAKGDVIFLSDQDDRWHADKVEKMVAELKKGDCVVSDCVVTDREWNVKYPSFFKRNHTSTNRLVNLLVKNGYIGGCMAFKRNVLEASLPFPKNTPMHDLWIGNVAAFFFSVSFIGEQLSDFRRSGSNVSRSGEKSAAPLLRRINYRFATIKGLLALFVKRTGVGRLSRRGCCGCKHDSRF